MKLSHLDKLFSEFIRKRALLRVHGCERCHPNPNKGIASKPASRPSAGSKNERHIILDLSGGDTWRFEKPMMSISALTLKEGGYNGQ